MKTPLTIDEALSKFLDEQRERLTPRTFRNYEDVIDLLRRCLDGYGPNLLTGADRERWQRAYSDGDEDAFCTLMSADYIPRMLGEFLGYYMVRKVVAGPELLRASGTVTEKLVEWLHEQGLVDASAADQAAQKAKSAARDLPSTERLTNALHKLSLTAPIHDRASAERWIEQDLPLTITNVEPGELWFEDNIGPVPVPTEIAELAQTGWALTAILAYARNRWWLLEVGNVYPEK